MPARLSVANGCLVGLVNPPMSDRSIFGHLLREGDGNCFADCFSVNNVSVTDNLRLPAVADLISLIRHHERQPAQQLPWKSNLHGASIGRPSRSFDQCFFNEPIALNKAGIWWTPSLPAAEPSILITLFTDPFVGPGK